MALVVHIFSIKPGPMGPYLDRIDQENKGPASIAQGVGSVFINAASILIPPTHDLVGLYIRALITQGIVDHNEKSNAFFKKCKL